MPAAPLAATALGLAAVVAPATAAGAADVQEVDETFVFQADDGSTVTCFLHAELVFNDLGDTDVTNDRLHALALINGRPECASREVVTLRYTVDTSPEQAHVDTVSGIDYALAEATPPKNSAYRKFSSEHRFTFDGCDCGPTYQFVGPK